MSEMMDRLLSMELPQPETAKVKLKRLGVTLTLRELSYNQVHACVGEEGDVQMVLSGVTDPNLRDEAWWRDKMGCPTAAEAVKKLLRPGEIRAVVNRLDRLAGFNALVLEDITKN